MVCVALVMNGIIWYSRACQLIAKTLTPTERIAPTGGERAACRKVTEPLLDHKPHTTSGPQPARHKFA